MELQRDMDEFINQLHGEVRAEMHAMRAKFAHLRAIDSAVDTERDPATWLN